MSDTICGVDCAQCSMKDVCGGCAETSGRPFGGECVVAECCKGKGSARCEGCGDSVCELKNKLISEFNALGVEGMPQLTELVSLQGAFINLEYTLPSGQTAKLLDDNKIYLGYQLQKENSARCYGVTADESRLLVCEYGEGGSDPEIVIYKKR